MAIRVPIYQRRVSQGALPTVRERGTDVASRATAQSARSLADVGRGVTQAGAGIASAVRDIGAAYEGVKVRAEDAALNEAYADLAAAKQHWLEDPEQGLASVRGKDAIERRREFTQSFAEAAKRIRDGDGDEGQGLPSERVKEAFDRMLQRESLQFESSVDRYVARETEEVEQQALDAALSASRSEAIGATRRNEMGAAEDAIGKGLGALQSRAEALGWEPEFLGKQAREFETAARLGVLESMLDSGRSRDAAEYLAASRVYMDEATIQRSNIDAKIQAATVTNDAKTLADQLFVAAGNDAMHALEALQEIPAAQDNPSLRYETRQNILRLGQQKRQAESLHDEPLIDHLELGMREGRGAGFNTQEYKDLTEGGKAKYRRMAVANARASRAASSQARSYQREIDRDADAEYRGMPVEERATVNLRDAFPDASDRQVNLLRERQNKDKENLTKLKPADVKVFRSEVESISARAQLKGWQGTKVKKGSEADEFHAYMQDWFMQAYDEKGRPPTLDEARKAAAEALLYGEEPGTGIFDERDTRAFRAKRQGREFDPSDFEEENRQLLKQLGLDEPENAPAPSKPTPTSRPAGTVRVRKPDGSTGIIPSGKVDAFMRAFPGSEVVGG